MLKYEIYIDVYPTMTGLMHLRHSEKHRVDGPALIIDQGSLMWYQYEELHRKDGPAAIYKNGAEAYCRRGISCIEDNESMFFE